MGPVSSVFLFQIADFSHQALSQVLLRNAKCISRLKTIKSLMPVVTLEKDTSDNLPSWTRDAIENALALFDKLPALWLLECFSDILPAECSRDKRNVVYLFEPRIHKLIKNVEAISEF